MKADLPHSERLSTERFVKMKRLQKRLSDATKRESQHKTDFGAQRGQLEQLEKELTELSATNARQTVEIMNLEDKLEQEKQSKERILTELEKSRRISKKSCQSQAELQGKLHETVSSLKRMRESFSIVEKENSTLSRECARLESVIEHGKAELETLRMRNVSMGREKTKMLVEIRVLQQKIQALSQNIEKERKLRAELAIHKSIR
ncbi:hypothetical protein ADUPG1_005952 [Aduncisulcus paluster]|uniref:Uncharacterized protein n=1 Tax=Aduncisulcus paluster TaxID=2918883 RepID=A0ABQ5KGC0_9EUKA|nr:hypothetical protein ADUPG1_005952 [Aduncisulcus paluster]